jgi:hypothetical protein
MHVLALATISLDLHGDPARRLVFVSFAWTSSLPKVATGLRMHRRIEFMLTSQARRARSGTSRRSPPTAR